MLIPPDMRLHLTKHNIQALSPHVRSPLCGSMDSADRFLTSLVPPKDKVASCLIFASSEADIHQLSYHHARSECRPRSVESGQSARWLRYVWCRRASNSFELPNVQAVLYNMSKKLAQILTLPLVLHNISAPRLRYLKQNDPKVHKSDNVPPEVALISTAIVVLRLVYGFDGRTRYVSWDGSSTILTATRTSELPLTLGIPPMHSQSWASIWRS